MTLRHVVYLPPILLSAEPFAVNYRQRIVAEPCHSNVTVLFRERPQVHPLAFPLLLNREDQRALRLALAVR